MSLTSEDEVFVSIKLDGEAYASQKIMTVKEYIVELDNDNIEKIKIIGVPTKGNLPDYNPVLHKFEDNWIEKWKDKDYKDYIYNRIVEFSSGKVARVSGNIEMLIKLAEDGLCNQNT